PGFVWPGTSPANTSACACERDSARPRSTNSTSTRLFVTRAPGSRPSAHDDDVSARDDAAGAKEAHAVVRAGEAHDLDVPPGLGRMNHAALAEVQADVAEPLEEQDVASLELSRRNAPALCVQRVGAVRKVDPHPAVRPAHEPRAIESTGRRFATPPVGDTYLVEREPRRE